MNPIEQISAGMYERWSKMTLGELRFAASSEPTGIAFESMRAAGGQRMILVVCLTDTGPIRIVEKAFQLTTGGPPFRDWLSGTILEMVTKTIEGNGVSYEDMRDNDDQRSAIVLCTCRPDVIALLEKLFTFPK